MISEFSDLNPITPTTRSIPSYISCSSLPIWRRRHAITSILRVQTTGTAIRGGWEAQRDHFFKKSLKCLHHWSHYCSSTFVRPDPDYAIKIINVHLRIQGEHELNASTNNTHTRSASGEVRNKCSVTNVLCITKLAQTRKTTIDEDQRKQCL